uniref:Slit homolog 3 protein-like n=1 Tax=Saccoglossus kowalevskii TaxID=10224 RepID=A0ABM0MVF2_SACKO|nr:PREDICTED: slit homolog 3 protein-like [Saccoglossus kowalevskii]
MSWQITLFIYVGPILLMNSGTLKGCPSECSCEDSDGKLYVDCSHGGLSEIPPNIPSDTTRLVLEHNDLTRIPEHAFMDLYGLVYINLGWNAINDISPNAFSGVASLTELILHSNGLTSLSETVFNELPNLKKLNISYNSLTSLPSEIFHNLTDLTTLDLSYNNLQSLNSSSFHNLTALEFLLLAENPWSCDCHMEAFKRWIHNNTQLRQQQVPYMGQLLTGNGLIPDTMKVSAIAKMPRLTDKKAVRLLGSMDYLSRVMPNLSKVCEPLPQTPEKNVEFMWESHQAEAFTTSAPLFQYHHIKMSWQITLFIYVVPILLMNSGTLKGCPSECSCEDSDGELHVDCSHGDMSEIPSNIPSDTTRLVLEHNDLTTVPEHAFIELYALVHINLGWNEITEISPSAFAGVTRLTELLLHRNRLTSLPETVFKELPNLGKLDISYNSLTSLPSEIFHNLTDLTTLDLSYNNLQSLNTSIFNRLYNLLELRLHTNDITFLPSSIFHALTKLIYLSVSYNELTSLSTTHFSTLTSLRSLQLYNNKLTALPRDIFKPLTELTSLHIGSNQLHSLTIHNLTQLVTLHASHNRFTDISFQQELTENAVNIFGLPNLRYLYLQNNDITHVHGTIDIFSGINSLMLGFNKLTFLPRLPSGLRHLYLENNKFAHLPDTIQSLSNLHRLTLNSNELKHLPNFHNLTALQVLKLSGNPWSCDCHMTAFKRWIHNNTQVDTQLICQYPIEYTGTNIVNLTVSDLQCLPPKFNSPFEWVYVGIGESITLTVNVNVPLPHIQWIPPSGIVIGTERDSVVRLESDGSLFIPSVQNDLVGSYVCIANYDKDQAVAVRYLQIRSPPRATTTYATGLPPTTYIPETTSENTSRNILFTINTRTKDAHETAPTKQDYLPTYVGYVASFIMGSVIGTVTIVFILCCRRHRGRKQNTTPESTEVNIDLPSRNNLNDDPNLHYADLSNVDSNIYQQLTTINNVTGGYVNSEMLATQVVPQEDGEHTENIYHSVDA